METLDRLQNDGQHIEKDQYDDESVEDLTGPSPQIIRLNNLINPFSQMHSVESLSVQPNLVFTCSQTHRIQKVLRTGQIRRQEDLGVFATDQTQILQVFF